MDDNTWISSLSESKVSADLTRRRFHVFSQGTGKAPFDKIAYKDGVLYRISVKSCIKETSPGCYKVLLKSIRHNTSGYRAIKFDRSSCDYVAIYLADIDKICYIKSQDISSGNGITLRAKPTGFVGKGKSQYIIDDYGHIG